MNDVIVSQIRTTVPAVVGAALAWLSMKLGADIDGATAGAAAATVCTSIYYGIARQLERRWGFFGVLLGARKAPTYQGK